MLRCVVEVNDEGARGRRGRGRVTGCVIAVVAEGLGGRLGGPQLAIAVKLLCVSRHRTAFSGLQSLCSA